MPDREHPEIHNVFCGLSWLSDDQTVRHNCIGTFLHTDNHLCKCGATIA